jgi:hypothetical protein
MEENVAEKTWLSKRDKCDLCKWDISKECFIDGRTTYGPWALMCESCHGLYGVGLGTGRGQKYDKTGKKIAG